MVCLSDLWEGEGNRGELGGGGGHPEAQCGPLVIARGNADSLQFFFSSSVALAAHLCAFILFTHCLGVHCQICS